jgi:hypothetical protein
MTYIPVLDLLADMQRETAEQANKMAAAGAGFDAIGAGAGVGVRLKALADVHAAVVALGLKEHEESKR